MTPEQTALLLPIITAYSQGKTVQYRSRSTLDGWTDGWDYWFNPALYEYRIKPTPKLRPFRRGEIKCGDVVKAKKSGNYFFVSGESDLGILIGFGWVTYEALLDDYTMADGSPCGKEEEE